MKIKEGFILHKVGRQFVVAVTGEASKDFNGMLRLDEEAAYAFGLLQEGIEQEDLVTALAEKYHSDPAETVADVAAFLEKLQEAQAFV